MEKKAEYKTETTEKNLLDQIVENTIIIHDQLGNEKKLVESELKKLYAPTATETEYLLFKNQIKSMNLDPDKREIYFTKYTSKDGSVKVSVVTGFQVYIARALASGKMAEMYHVEIEKPTENPDSWIGHFSVKRSDIGGVFELPIPIKDFNKHQSTWNIMTEYMSMKTTASIGMRWAFADVLGGMPYTVEELTSKAEPEDDYIYEGKIEPTKEELEAKEQAKNDTLANLMTALSDVKTLKDLDKRYKANNAKYETSELKNSIIALYATRKRQLMIEAIQNVTNAGFGLTQIDEWLDTQNAKSNTFKDNIIPESLSGNKDAINELSNDIAKFIDSQKEQESSQEEMTEEEQEEMDLAEMRETGVE